MLQTQICVHEGIAWGQHGSGFNLSGMNDHCVFHVSPMCKGKLEMTPERYREDGNCCSRCSSWMQNNSKGKAPLEF